MEYVGGELKKKEMKIIISGIGEGKQFKIEEEENKAKKIKRKIEKVYSPNKKEEEGKKS